MNVYQKYERSFSYETRRTILLAQKEKVQAHADQNAAQNLFHLTAPCLRNKEHRKKRNSQKGKQNGQQLTPGHLLAHPYGRDNRCKGAEHTGQGSGFTVGGESKAEDRHSYDAETEARHPLSETRQKRDGKNP